MQNIKEMTKKEIIKNSLENNFNEALKNPEFANLVKKIKMPKSSLIKFTSKFENTCQELHNCQSCKGLYECKNDLNGHVFSPKIIADKLYFTYVACRYQKLADNFETTEQKLTHITMKDIDTKDKKQLKIIKWMDEFFEQYDPLKNMKGLYLHGSFGSGKTFLLTALLNELAHKKQATIEIVYVADMLRDLKEDWENFSYKMKYLMQVDLLLLDDLGAEKVTEWGRDEILGTILQNRMNNHKTTFFTSNLTISELEEHLSLSSSGVDKVKARRIIERIKQLSTDMELISENRRN